MASSRKTLRTNTRYIYSTSDLPNTNTSSSSAVDLDLDEADVVWSSEMALQPSEPPKNPLPSSRPFKKAGAHGGKQPAVASSLPVSVPEWSKILKGEYREKNGSVSDEDDESEEEDERGIRVPPHEYLARRRGASFSVQEGLGRTLKGRDLRRVRNAIWEKTGFQD